MKQSKIATTAITAVLLISYYMPWFKRLKTTTWYYRTRRTEKRGENKKQSHNQKEGRGWRL